MNLPINKYYHHEINCFKSSLRNFYISEFKFTHDEKNGYYVVSTIQFPNIKVKALSKEEGANLFIEEFSKIENPELL